MNDDKFHDPNELLAELYGEGADIDRDFLPLPDVIYYVPDDLELFSFGHVIVSANELIQLAAYTKFSDDDLILWEHQATEYLKLTAPEYAVSEELEEPDDGFNVSDYPELRPLDEFFEAEETRMLAEALGTTPFAAGAFYGSAQPPSQDHWETHPVYLLAKTDIRREHLVPDVTGTLVTSLSAMNLYGLLAYRKHPKIRAFYVKAQR